MEEKQDAWKMLLESLDETEKQSWDMRKREIEILQKLMDREQHIKLLNQVIAELTVGKDAKAQTSESKDFDSAYAEEINKDLTERK